MSTAAVKAYVMYAFRTRNYRGWCTWCKRFTDTSSEVNHARVVRGCKNCGETSVAVAWSLRMHEHNNRMHYRDLTV